MTFNFVSVFKMYDMKNFYIIVAISFSLSIWDCLKTKAYRKITIAK